MKWYKCDPQETMEQMATLSLEERGAYATLINLLHIRDGNLRDDERFVAGYMGCDLRVWRRIKGRLVGLGLISCEGGRIESQTVTSTIKQAERIAEMNGTKGRKSGAVRRKIKDLQEQTSKPDSDHYNNNSKKEEGVITPSVRASEPKLDLEPRGAGALRAEGDTRRAKAARWPEFRAAYPRREGSQSWPAAEKKYVAMVASGVAEDAIIDGARRYGESLRLSGSLGTRFVKHASAWLNQRGWEDEYLTGTGRRQQSDLMDAFNAERREAAARSGDRLHAQGGFADAWSEDEVVPPF